MRLRVGRNPPSISSMCETRTAKPCSTASPSEPLRPKPRRPSTRPRPSSMRRTRSENPSYSSESDTTAASTASPGAGMTPEAVAGPAPLALPGAAPTPAFEDKAGTATAERRASFALARSLVSMERLKRDASTRTSFKAASRSEPPGRATATENRCWSLSAPARSRPSAYIKRPYQHRLDNCLHGTAQGRGRTR